ncbi:hypothetical protein BK732_19355 [Bacillus thuringiensis serovar navarrensis]|uniref:Uncharacterized protein n=1 Tax=Bacillus thuringiensis serovar navarrensis TaxID=339658 RepID=A0A243AAA4_BACTU|nr:hypothetical protein [Bacillus thuringiensis]OTY15287.1 hypothetical protein BK732_19355 [Bacillus thuringiensis serovar navarrensis]
MLMIVLIAIGVFLFISQIYIATLLHKYESSWWWGGLSFLLPLGLNVYVYQIIILEKRSGDCFEKLNPKERKLWRKIYFLVLMQYMFLFSCFGFLASPALMF